MVDEKQRDSGDEVADITDEGASSFSDKHPELLPTPRLSPAEFEDFTQRLLNAYRFCTDQIRHVTRVARWGRPGDKQDGIDFEGDFSDGASRWRFVTPRHRACSCGARQQPFARE